MVTLSSNLSDGESSEQLSNDLIEDIMADLQELALEIANLKRYFEEPPLPTAEDSTAVSLVSKQTFRPSTVNTTAWKLQQATRRMKGKLKISYKQDRLMDIKNRLKEHVVLLHVLCSARTL